MVAAGMRETLGGERGGVGMTLPKGSGPVLFVRVIRSTAERRSGDFDSRKLSLGVCEPGESLEGINLSGVDWVVGKRTKFGQRGVLIDMAAVRE